LNYFNLNQFEIDVTILKSDLTKPASSLDFRITYIPMLPIKTDMTVALHIQKDPTPRRGERSCFKKVQKSMRYLEKFRVVPRWV
jgi:hypothetical protein